MDVRPPGPDQAGDQNHQDGPVENRRVENPGLRADQHRGQRGRGLVDAQPEHQSGFVAGVSQASAGQAGGRPFEGGHAGRHVQRDSPAVQAGEQRAQVHAHADGEQEKGNEERVADEMQPACQHAAAGHDGAERQSGEKGADDRFHARQFRQPGDQKRGGQDKDEFGGAVRRRPAEKPVAQARQQENRTGHQCRQRQPQPDPEGRAGLAAAFHDNGQHQQCRRIGEDGAADGRGDGAVPAQPQPLHGRERDQGMRREHARQQNGLGPGESQQPDRAQRTQHLRDQEGQRAEHQAGLAVADELIEIDFQSRQEHQVQESHLAQQLEGLINVKDPQSVFPDDHAGENQARDVRQAQFHRQEGCRQQQHHHQREVQDEAVGIHGRTLAGYPLRRKSRLSDGLGAYCNFV